MESNFRAQSGHEHHGVQSFLPTDKEVQVQKS